MSVARFVGGPWNGQTREIPDALPSIEIAQATRPAAFTRSEIDRPEAFAMSYRRMTYVRAARTLAGDAIYVPAEPVEICDVDRMRNSITVTIALEALENMDARDLLDLLRLHADRQMRVCRVCAAPGGRHERGCPADGGRTRDLLADRVARTMDVPREMLDDVPPWIRDEIMRRVSRVMDMDTPIDVPERREPTQAEIVAQIARDADRPMSSDPHDAMGTPHYAAEHRCPDCDVEWTGTSLCWSCGKDVS